MTRVPRRIDMQRWSDGEHAIQRAVTVVEEMGAHPKLTDAVILLGKARGRVADFVDGVTVSYPRDVYDDIQDERAKQDAEWGGSAHDDKHTCHEWWEFRRKHEVRVAALLDSPHDGVYEPADARLRLVKIAALVVAQIEALDRKHSRTGA